MFKYPKLKPVTSVGHILVGDEDETTFTITHPKHLTVFATPLANKRDAAQHGHGHPEAELKAAQHAVVERHGSETSSEKDHESVDPEEPVLKRAHEASTIQLFYDLFFVANLTTFTQVHEIDDVNSK